MMIYVYEQNGEVVYSRDTQPREQIPYILLERMIPKPVKQGFKSVLRANFESKEVWYEFEDIRTVEEKNRVIAALREAAYKKESDSLYMSYQKYTALGDVAKSEVEKAKWLEKISEINDRYPYVEDSPEEGLNS